MNRPKRYSAVGELERGSLDALARRLGAVAEHLVSP